MVTYIEISMNTKFVGYSTNQGNGWFWLVLVGFGWF